MKLKFFKKSKKIRWQFKSTNLIIALLACLLVLAILFLCTLSWGVYKLDWRGQFVDQIMSYLPLPAAKVDNTYILFPEYLQALKAAEKFYAKQKEANYPNVPDSDKLKQIVLEDRLIANILVKKIAKGYNISVSQADIDAKIDEIVQNSGSQDKFEKFLKEYYGLDILGYIKIFVIPNLYYDKTNQAVIEDNLINGDAKKKAQEALNKLRNNESFEEVAKIYSDDINKDKNASQENFLRGELAKDIEDELFSMKEGTYTDIITLPDSYAIFKLLKKDENKGVLTTQRIVIKLKTLDNLITEQKQKAQIKIYAY